VTGYARDPSIPAASGRPRDAHDGRSRRLPMASAILRNGCPAWTGATLCQPGYFSSAKRNKERHRGWARRPRGSRRLRVADDAFLLRDCDQPRRKPAVSVVLCAMRGSRTTKTALPARRGRVRLPPRLTNPGCPCAPAAGKDRVVPVWPAGPGLPGACRSAAVPRLFSGSAECLAEGGHLSNSRPSGVNPTGGSRSLRSATVMTPVAVRGASEPRRESSMSRGRQP